MRIHFNCVFEILLSIRATPQAQLNQRKIDIRRGIERHQFGDLGEGLQCLLILPFAEQASAQQLIRGRVIGVFLQNKVGFFLGIAVISRRQIETSSIQPCVHSSRINGDGVFQGCVSIVPLVQGKTDLRQLVVGVHESWIQFQRIAKLDGGFLVLAFLHVSEAALEVLYFALLRIAGTTGEHREKQEQGKNGHS